MRILDDKSDKSLNRITLYLTKSEVHQLFGYAKQLLEEKNSDHFHLSSEDYHKEITICLYDSERINELDDRSKKLILKDE